MNMLKLIMEKFSENKKDELQEEWIEIVYSLDELDNILLAEALRDSL